MVQSCLFVRDKGILSTPELYLTLSFVVIQYCCLIYFWYIIFAELFMCSNGYAVPDSLKCDGEKDCDDGSDENNCRRFLASM